MTNKKRSSSGYPFTALQWQELEQQALIYKYMVSGLPIPSDLIHTMRRSLLFDYKKTSRSMSFLTRTQLGWSCVQMGFGRKVEDPEPGRCRRTDGKKWRCSLEVYPGSKYCERHMHRGKNRSRKHAEISPAISTNTYSMSSSTHHSHPANLSLSTPDTYHILKPHSKMNRPPGSQFSTISRTSNLQKNKASFLNTDYRYGERIKHLEGHRTFSDASGTRRKNTSQLKPLGLSSLIEANQRNYSLSKEMEEERLRQTFGAEKENLLQLKPLGTSSLIDSLSKEEEEERQRPLRHFFQ